MTTRMTPHGEQEIDDFYEAPEAPTPCVNCGSPACEWPGRCEELIYVPGGGPDEEEPEAEGAPLEAPEEILDILNDLIEWDAYVGPFENEVWDRARAIRDRLVAK